METKEYLNMIVEEIHSTIIATVDKEGFPVTRVIDIMLADNTCLYFITAKGKSFYEQLICNPNISLSGMTNGKGSMNKKAISIHGKVISIGIEKINEIIEKNPYIAEIYPNEESRMALEVFKIYEGRGEYFDLSSKPIMRKHFLLGASEESKSNVHGYFITDNCHGCRICYSKCPQKCIDLSVKPFVIRQENCLHCGNCISVCPFGAVERRQ